jgi:hypothetical protein
MLLAALFVSLSLSRSLSILKTVFTPKLPRLCAATNASMHMLDPQTNTRCMLLCFVLLNLKMIHTKKYKAEDSTAALIALRCK